MNERTGLEQSEMGDPASAAVAKTTGPDPLIGRSINDRFQITGLIARGGMGKVYRAVQSPLGRVCALKVLNPNYAGEHDPEFHKRFFLEASIASKLTHPNTVTIFDYGRTEDDIYYMAMEFLEGQTLHRAIREAGHFPEERAAHIARQICRALREAHSLGVIHRDLKPANIFLMQHGDETDFVKVLDFGLVKNVGDNKSEDLTQTGLFMGSPKYMAPEQIRGDRVDARTDIYALGIILYEMVTGKVPFDRPNSVNILMAHVNEEPPPMRSMNPNIQLSPVFEDSVKRSMAKDPDQRFKSMDEVLTSLKRVGGAAGATSTMGGVAGTGEYRSMAMTGTSMTMAGTRPQLSGTQQVPYGTPSTTPQGSPNGVVGPFGSAEARRELLRGLLGGTEPPASFLSPTSSEPGVNASPFTVLPLSASSKQDSVSEKEKTKRLIIIAVAVAIVVVVLIAALVGRSSGSDQVTNTGTGESATERANDVPALRMHVSTEPDQAIGASVKEDGVEVCPATPCDILYRGADADPRKEHRLVFSKRGFRDEPRIVTIADAPLAVRMTRTDKREGGQ